MQCGLSHGVHAPKTPRTSVNIARGRPSFSMLGLSPADVSESPAGLSVTSPPGKSDRPSFRMLGESRPLQARFPSWEGRPFTGLIEADLRRVWGDRSELENWRRQARLRRKGWAAKTWRTAVRPAQTDPAIADALIRSARRGVSASRGSACDSTP